MKDLIGGGIYVDLADEALCRERFSKYSYYYSCLP